MIMNGVRDDLPLEDAIGIAGMLITLGRAVHPSSWVDWMTEQVENSYLNSRI